MRPLLAGVVVLGLLTACSSGVEPAPAVTVTAPAPTPSVEEYVPEETTPDPNVLLEYVGVATQIAEVANSMGSSDADVLTACVQMGTLGQDGLALPDTGLTSVDKYWDKGMASYVAAGSFCVSGDYDAALDALEAGNRAIDKATAALG